MIIILFIGTKKLNFNETGYLFATSENFPGHNLLFAYNR